MDENRPAQPPAGPQPGPPPQHPAPSSGQPAAAEPFYKRHGLAFAISTLVLAVIVLFGAVGVGAFTIGSLLLRAERTVSRLVDDGESGRHVQPQPQNPGQPRDDGGFGPEQGPLSGIVRGTIAKISGSTWTLTTQRNATVTVQTTSSTEYGIPGQNGDASDFAEGDRVIVIGERTGDRVIAARILNLSDLPMGPWSTPGPSATPGS